MKMFRAYVCNCFWFLVPILVFNVMFARHLPAAYQSNIFWRDIPRSISVPENVLRVLAMVVPAVLPVVPAGASTRTVGAALYLVGLVLYFASWSVLMSAPHSAWSRSAIGFMAPAWTPVIWFVGIALLGDERLVVPAPCYRRWMFVLLCLAFLSFHNAHTALVFMRQ